MSVYFAEAGSYIKIGYSKDPLSRIGTITRTGKRPSDLPFAADADLIGWVPGDTRIEGVYHARFIDSRVDGEWFSLARGDLEELIWRDPCGILLERMSTMAVVAAARYPGVTRDQIEAAGIPVKPVGPSLLDGIFASVGGAA